MSNRRKAGVKNRTMAYIAAAVVHLLLIGVLLFNFTSKTPHETVEAFDAEKLDTVKASVIDESQIKDQQEKLKKAERERERKKREKKKREQDELKKIKQQADQEKKKVADLKAKQKLEQENLRKQREAIALKKKKDEEIAKKKEAAEKKRIADLQKQVEREEADLRERQRINKLLAEEEAERQQQEAERRAKERTATLTSKYFSGIRQKVESRRTVDPSFETWRKSVVDIKLSPSGDVLSVRTIESSGSPQYDQAGENAIFAASPFELPDQNQYPEVFKRFLNFDLEIVHPNARR